MSYETPGFNPATFSTHPSVSYAALRGLAFIFARSIIISNTQN